MPPPIPHLIEAHRTLLARIYNEPGDPGAFGGAERLYRSAHSSDASITRRAVRQFLETEYAYTLHRPARRHFARNHIYVGGIDRQWQADLADMQQLARANAGARYILTVVDVFSKYAWAAALRDKSAKTVADAFAQVLARARPRCPSRLQTDKGKEFVNASFAALMHTHGIAHFASKSGQKAACAERLNRTLKTRLFTLMTARATQSWIDALDAVVDAYNHSHHRSIGMCPASVRRADQDRIWASFYGDGQTWRKRAKYLQGEQCVRISRLKREFEKGYTPNWSSEHYIVTRRCARQPPPPPAAGGGGGDGGAPPHPTPTPPPTRHRHRTRGGGSPCI